jgi:anti-sigma B factor antagonist
MHAVQPHPQQSIRATRAREAGRLAIRSDRRRTAHVITASGELDLATAAVLADELDAVLSSDAQLIELDLSGLTFVALRGLRVVSAARARALAQGKRLELRRFPAHIQRVAEMTASLDARAFAA